MKLNRHLLILVLFSFTACFMAGCSINRSKETFTTEPVFTSPVIEPVYTTSEPTTNNNTSEKIISSHIEKMPTILKNVASGKAVSNDKGVSIDYSNISDGYIMVKMEGAKSNLKVRITYDDSIIYDYDLNTQGNFEAFPLQSGNGKYTIAVYHNTNSGRYMLLHSVSVICFLTDELSPFLFPNQRINYTSTDNAIKKSIELCENLSSDEDKIAAIYNYVINNIKYDHEKALKVATQNNYISNADTTLDTKSGICVDYAVLIGVMLRAQGIPTKMIYGSARGASWHAWNKVYVNNEWVILDATFAANNTLGEDYIETKNY